MSVVVGVRVYLGEGVGYVQRMGYPLPCDLFHDACDVTYSSGDRMTDRRR